MFVWLTLLLGEQHAAKERKKCFSFSRGWVGVYEYTLYILNCHHHCRCSCRHHHRHWQFHYHHQHPSNHLFILSSLSPSSSPSLVISSISRAVIKSLARHLLSDQPGVPPPVHMHHVLLTIRCLPSNHLSIVVIIIFVIVIVIVPSIALFFA